MLVLLDTDVDSMFERVLEKVLLSEPELDLGALENDGTLLLASDLIDERESEVVSSLVLLLEVEAEILLCVADWLTGELEEITLLLLLLTTDSDLAGDV